MPLLYSVLRLVAMTIVVLAVVAALALLLFTLSLVFFF